MSSLAKVLCRFKRKRSSRLVGILFEINFKMSDKKQPKAVHPRTPEIIGIILLSNHYINYQSEILLIALKEQALTHFKQPIQDSGWSI